MNRIRMKVAIIMSCLLIVGMTIPHLVLADSDPDCCLHSPPIGSCDQELPDACYCTHSGGGASTCEVFMCAEPGCWYRGDNCCRNVLDV